MRKLCTILIVLALVLQCAVFLPSQAQATENHGDAAKTNAIINGDFENGTNGWKFSSYASEGVIGTITLENDGAGNHLVQIVSDDNKARCISQSFDATAYEVWEVSLRYKASGDRSGYAGIWFYQDQVNNSTDPNGEYLYFRDAIAVSLTDTNGEWKEISFQAIVPTGANIGLLEIGNNSRTMITMQIDDVTLTKTQHSDYVLWEEFENRDLIRRSWTASNNWEDYTVNSYTEQYNDTRSLYVQKTGAWARSPAFSVTAGGTYQVSFVSCMWENCKLTGYAKLVFLDAAGEIVYEETIDAAVGPTDTWNEHYFEALAPSGAVDAYLEFGCGGTGSGSFGIDHVVVNTDLPHKWKWVYLEPTYTNMGTKKYLCSECGEVKHTVYTSPAKFYGTSINLGNTLDMYFGFYTGLVDENGTVKFVREFADGTAETTTAPIASFNKNNSVYDITYTGLAAKEMCDTIHVYVYNGDGELVGQHSDSIRSYILRQLREKNYGQEFRTLCVDLLNYGAAAQTAFDYRADDLANKDLTAEELAEGTQKVAAYTDKQTVSGMSGVYYGTAYLLETKITMSMAVRMDALNPGCYALVSYTDHTGKEKNNIHIEGIRNYSVYEFFLDEIVVADGRCLLSIEFYKADGTLVATVQDSMESYTARNAATYPLAEKMLAFSDSAYNYLHRTDSEIDNDDIAKLDVNLLQSKKYVAYELIEDNELLMEYTIMQNPSFEDNVMIFSTGVYYYYAEPDFDTTNAKSVQYGGKTYYGGDGGFGGYWLVVNGNTLDAYDEWNAWLYADSQSNATYVMQRNGDLMLIKGDADQYPYLWTSQMS